MQLLCHKFNPLKLDHKSLLSLKRQYGLENSSTFSPVPSPIKRVFIIY